MILSKIAKQSISYGTAYPLSIKDPVYYWKHEAQHINWHTFPKTMLRVDDLHFYRWFPDGKLNIS